MSDYYTPTTDEVRERFSALGRDFEPTRFPEVQEEAFVRWLAGYATGIREEIAREIEGSRNHFMRITSTPLDHPLAGVYGECALIARANGIEDDPTAADTEPQDRTVRDLVCAECGSRDLPMVVGDETEVCLACHGKLTAPEATLTDIEARARQEATRRYVVGVTVGTQWIAESKARAFEAGARWVASLPREVDLPRALDLLARIVALANISAIDGEDGFVASYDMPVGPIHAAIPFLASHGIVATIDGRVLKTPGHDFLPVAGHPDDDECSHRSDGTDATYCGLTRDEHGYAALPREAPTVEEIEETGR